LAVSKPLDRDRAVDESGNQIAVFGRRGARPFTSAEVQRMMRTNRGTGDYFSVSDEPATEPERLSSNSSTVISVAMSLALGLLAISIQVRRRRQSRT
jgi:uncharacterized protein (TIGR03382 family)